MKMRVASGVYMYVLAHVSLQYSWRGILASVLSLHLWHVHVHVYITESVIYIMQISNNSALF